MQTEYEFTLPRGYVDSNGDVHRTGVMRLATAMDEIEPLRDVRVKSNPAYLSIILLSRVMVRLGEVPSISVGLIESLFAADLAYLQAVYRQINEQGTTTIDFVCPQCQKATELNLADLGESVATP